MTRIGQSWSDSKYIPTASVQEHYDLGNQLLSEKKWEEALNNFMVILYHYEDSVFYADSIYYSAVCYYFLAHFDLAEKQFAHYLNQGGQLKHFERVFDFKYYIAQYYRDGRRKHLFGVEKLPRLASGKKSAEELYDEVIASLPSREIAAKSLAGKADMQRKRKEYKESIESLQAIIRRFPKHSLAAEAFLTIGEIYLQQSKAEAQNPDLIALAQVNYQKFRKSFPGDERSEAIEQNILAMQELCASSLYDTGRFFERLKKPQAAAIYYHDTMGKYPGTQSAEKSEERLSKISKRQAKTSNVV